MKPHAASLLRAELFRERGWALFLDVDGTLVDIEERPDDVVISEKVLQLVDETTEALSGALALVSGRSLDQLDRLFRPLKPAASGLHGLQWRTCDGSAEQAEMSVESLASARRSLLEFEQRCPGTAFEDKGFALALHYRSAPAFEPAVRKLMDSLLAELGDGFHLQGGKMVLELKPESATKAAVVERFMQHSPFRGRVPVFVGDDLTDEDGFAAVNELGGHSIRVGSGKNSSARFTLRDAADTRGWLRSLLELLRSRCG